MKYNKRLEKIILPEEGSKLKFKKNKSYDQKPIYSIF